MADPSTEGPRKGSGNDAPEDAEVVQTGASDSVAATESEADTPVGDPVVAAGEDEAGNTILAKSDTDAGAPPPPERQEPDEHHDHDDHHGPSFAATALKYLVIILVVFAASIWALPRIIPLLPEGMAQTLMPAQITMDERIAALEAAAAADASATDLEALRIRVADLEAALAAAQQEAEDARAAAQEAASAAQSASVAEGVVEQAGSSAERAASAAETATSAATEAGRVASAAMRDSASLARRMTGFEAQIASISEELTALGQGMAGTAPAEGEGGVSQEAAAAYTALKTRLDDLVAQIADAGYLTTDDAAAFVTQDDLRSARTALAAGLETAMAKLPAGDEIVTTTALDQMTGEIDTRIGALSDRVDAVETLATEAEAAATTARDEVSGAITAANLGAAVATLRSQLDTGQPFAPALARIEELSGSAAPDALSSVADAGVPTTRALARGFGRPYQDALAADLRERSDGGLLGTATARVRSIVAGRPKDAVEGETAEGVLSRIDAALDDGNASGALAEAETLSAPVQEAMGGWLDDLRARVAAEAAAADYTAGLGT